jgi:hypothetical protein
MMEVVDRWIRLEIGSSNEEQSTAGGNCEKGSKKC